MQRAYVESYGCSHNVAEGEQIKGYLRKHGVELSSLRDADKIIVNTCGVKLATENRMINRLRKLNALAEKSGKELVVTGCLPKINPARIQAVSPKIVQFGPRLERVGQLFGLKEEAYNPCAEAVRANPFVAILPISRGCLSACTYCGTRYARGRLKSFEPADLKGALAKAVATPQGFRVGEVGAVQAANQVWLTGTDTGCYGKDIGVGLPEMVRGLLEVEGDYRVRLGMTHPQWLDEYYEDFVALFEDGRLFRFVHVPVQSGSNRVLQAMEREYTREEFVSLCERLRRDVPGVTVSTDVIVAFPGETDTEFEETVSLLQETRPDIVNISRYGDRPHTKASRLPGKVYGWVAKARSRRLTGLCAEIALQRNLEMVGKRTRLVVSELGRTGGFIGRTENYKPVALDEDLRGRFVEARITAARSSYLEAEIA